MNAVGIAAKDNHDNEESIMMVVSAVRSTRTLTETVAVRPRCKEPCILKRKREMGKAIK